MTEIISITDIVQDPPKDYFMPSIGERTMAFIVKKKWFAN